MANDTGAQALIFQDVHFEPVARDAAETWLRYHQIGEALGHIDPRSVLNIYNSNAAEFTDNMTDLVKLPTAGGVQEVRIFSLRGAHLLGMFARTDRAAEFRRWVLDVLEHQTAPPTQSLPPPVAVDQVLATLQRVIAERDTLRGLVGERLLKDKPLYRRIIHYYKIPGLTMIERARLLGWKSTTQLFPALRELSACGLIDWVPDPGKVAVGRRQAAIIADKARRGELKVGAAKGTGVSPERMAVVRAARQRKAGAA